jgi:hypothetical protein
VDLAVTTFSGPVRVARPRSAIAASATAKQRATVLASVPPGSIDSTPPDLSSNWVEGFSDSLEIHPVAGGVLEVTSFLVSVSMGFSLVVASDPKRATPHPLWQPRMGFF